MKAPAELKRTMGKTSGGEDKEKLSPTNELQQKLRASAHLLSMGKTSGAEDKENLSPTNVLQKKLRASAHLLSPGVEARLPHNSLGKQRLSPTNARLILLKALGPSPSRQALKRFVAGLSRDERKLFLDDANGTMPGSPLSGLGEGKEKMSVNMENDRVLQTVLSAGDGEDDGGGKKERDHCRVPTSSSHRRRRRCDRDLFLN